MASQVESLEKLGAKQDLLLKHVTALARHVVGLPFERAVSVVEPTGYLVSASPAVPLDKSVNFIKKIFHWHTCQTNNSP
jgi:hypothetical protein